MGQRYVIREAKTKQELDEILDVIWAANYTPYEPFMQLFFPVLGYTSAHRDLAVAESKQRFWKQHQEDTSSHWFYAFDTVTNKTVGCSQWVISTVNPFAAGTPKLTAPWWPEGEYRSFCESILNQVYRPRANWMTRPHCALNWMAVDPAHRNRGVGSLLMHVGITRADGLDLECWMEASAMGKPLYDKFGFQSLLKIAFDNEKSEASDEWRKCAHELTPPPIFAMWRPNKSSGAGPQAGFQLPWSLGTKS
ncbi:hypothetical protein J4E86_008332 [Alternaria arbusti]|uniref:uncharacterized protein n=1 Tax=Alternaria arbusti TaxID=232088 RepID=UPI002220D233|nr:uncharacterized protein J4E86_008332 [Alternaria arbusti]KAI4947816.1 hypothetical protein J4E86_008332 [Alternaria arbusti]